MAGNSQAAWVNPSKDTIYDQSPQITMTTGRVSGIVEHPKSIPSSLSTPQAAKPDAGGESSTPDSRPSLKLRHSFSSTYHYPRLADEYDDIRILDLLPGEPDDPLCARLEPCPLSNRPSYEAISYAWGGKTDTAVISICEGGVDYTVEIPKSLHGALKQLRYLFSRRSIWADAICINQSDKREKNHQVPLMRRIYQGATTVIIWLGDDDDIPRRGNSLFEVISQLSQRNQLMPPPDDAETWTALRLFYKRPWFTRVWCLQEAILAPSAKVLLGKHSAPWKHIGLAATSLAKLPKQTRSGLGSSYGVRNACLMYLLSHTNEQQHVLSFLQLLADTRRFKATDFRDKIYGILGIPTTHSDSDAGETFLQPDYTKKLSEVYIECALVIIEKTQCLRLLSHVQHEYLPRRLADISEAIKADDTLVKVPSWVPRWHHDLTSSMQYFEQLVNDFEASASVYSDPAFKLKTAVRGRQLVTYGARMSPVKSVSRVLDRSRTLRHATPEAANEIWQEAFDHLKASTTDSTDALYQLSTLLTGGRDWSGHAIEDGEQHFADFLDFMYNPATLSDSDTEVDPNQAQGMSTKPSRDDGAPPRHPNMLVDSLFRPRTDLTLPTSSKPGREYYFQQAMHYACAWRRLVITNDSHVGLGPEVTAPGDVVCILQDAKVPLLLRPEADGISFKLVGEAYIQGMMFGEISIPEVEQIVLSDKPFVSLDEIGPRDEQLESEHDDSD